MRLVLIDWQDSFGCSSSWQEIEECKPQVMTCQSVGWLIYDGDDCKVVVPHLSTQQPEIQPQGCGDMTIPARAIIRIVELEIPVGSNGAATLKA